MPSILHKWIDQIETALVRTMYRRPALFYLCVLIGIPAIVFAALLLCAAAVIWIGGF